MNNVSQEKEVKKSSHILYFDVLNILAAFSVIWIHFGNEIHWYDGSTVWKMCVPIHVLTFWAVPVFFMLTGATLLGYRQKYDTVTFFKRRLLRGVAPYFIWGTIFIVIYRNTLFEGVSGTKNILNTLLSIYIDKKMEPIYWFFLPLVAIYLSVPVFSLLAKPENKAVLLYAVGMGILTISILPTGYNLFQLVFFPEQQYTWNGMWNMSALGGYSLYAVMGYWASTYEFTKKQRLLCYSGGILGALIRGLGLWFLSARDQVVPGVLMDYMCFPALFLALAIFVAMRYLNLDAVYNYPVLVKAITELSKCSLGVYLIHILVMRFMQTLPWIERYSVKWYYLYPLPTYMFCVAIVFAARKIPVIKKLFP